MQGDTIFSWPVRVYYEDTDAGGVVYHSQYLNFMERARTEWLRALGFEQTDLRDNLQILIVIHSLQITFKKPAKFNDLLTVKSQLTALGNSSWQCVQSIWRNDELLIEAQVKAAFVHTQTFKPTRIPAAILQVAKTLIPNS
jgi:acyl-CoA thioester hydrolase